MKRIFYVPILAIPLLITACSNDNSDDPFENQIPVPETYVFERNAGCTNVWGQVAKLTASDGLTGDMFGYSASVAGDVALTLGANDGVYIAGGIAKRYPELLDDGRFRTAFERKGRHRNIVQRIPTFLITHGQPGLLGASYCALAMTSGD